MYNSVKLDSLNLQYFGQCLKTIIRQVLTPLPPARGGGGGFKLMCMDVGRHRRWWGEGIDLHVEDILVSLVFSIIILWTFRILAHGKNQYSYVQIIRPIVLSKALKQTKAGLRSSGTPFLVVFLRYY